MECKVCLDGILKENPKIKRLLLKRFLSHQRNDLHESLGGTTGSTLVCTVCVRASLLYVYGLTSNTCHDFARTKSKALVLDT